MVKDYLYRVAWSDSDQAFIARVSEWPGLAAHGSTEVEALDALYSVVRVCLDDMELQGETPPRPLA
jgi:predicted RNase H-like HicB family nuclease